MSLYTTFGTPCVPRTVPISRPMGLVFVSANNCSTRRMEVGTWSFRFRSAGCTVWHQRFVYGPIYGRVGVVIYPPGGGGFGIREGGPTEGVPGGDLRGADSSGSGGSRERREDDIFGVCCMEGRGGGAEGEICLKYLSTEQALAKGECTHGKDTFFCDGLTAQRHSDVVGREERVTALSPSSGHLPLLRVPVSNALLPLHSVALQLVTLCPLAHQVAPAALLLPKGEVRVSHVSVYRRLACRPVSPWETFYREGLRTGEEAVGQVVSAFGDRTASVKGVQEGEPAVGPSRDAHRHCGNESVCIGGESKEGATAGEEGYFASAEEPPHRFSRPHAALLWVMCIIDNLRSARSLLQALHLFRYVLGGARGARAKKKGGLRAKRPPLEAHAKDHEKEWEDILAVKLPQASTRYLRVRLCRQSLRDIAYWRSLNRREGRDLIRMDPHWTMHSDAADIWYGGTLGLEVGKELPGLWEGRGFWNAEDRERSITLRELRAVRLLLHRNVTAYASDHRTRRILLHEDNQAVVYILNAMFSALKEMMVELRKLEVLLRVLGVRLEAHWIPSAVNRFADALSRTWDPGDARATDALLSSIMTEYRLSHVVFKERLLGDTLVARKKYALTQMQEDWGDWRSRLWNPPFNLLVVFVRKIVVEGRSGVVIAPMCPAQAWYARLRALSSRMVELHPEEGTPLLEGEGTVKEAWSVVLAEIT